MPNRIVSVYVQVTGTFTNVKVCVNEKTSVQQILELLREKCYVSTVHEITSDGRHLGIHELFKVSHATVKGSP